ncbi:adenylate kinase 1 [Trypanosoma cruzi]|uniref:Adenylate kinase 1 n=1 Tax=Trypanosoma cruzi TaxID=5693 RepID=A0A2V2WS03_TRYCR|nr:adenylate kinase 1 [Trypanosoma cruzi]RNC34861.1 putative adenylate kinase [Trypanosoma cruzi]
MHVAFSIVPFRTTTPNVILGPQGLFLVLFRLYCSGHPMNLLIFGAPGCGKGSVSEALERDFGLLHISAGELMREEVEKGTPVGRRVAALMNEGSLIPDKVIVDIMVKRLREPDAREKGVVLDGFPRTLSQAQALTENGFEIDAMVFINVDVKLLEERCLQRRMDPVTGRIYNLKSDPPPESIMGRLLIRSDDTLEKHQRRMRIYREQKSALMKHYEKLIIEVDGNPPLPVVYAALHAKIDQLRKAKRKSKL